MNQSAQLAPNFENFLLLILAVCGAVVDNRYKARGGKREEKGWWKAALAFVAAVVVLFVYLSYRGVSSDGLATLTGNLVVWTFAAYELRRFLIRRANPVLTFKK
jgi:hypothetical protein